MKTRLITLLISLGVVLSPSAFAQNRQVTPHGPLGSQAGTYRTPARTNNTTYRNSVFNRDAFVMPWYFGVDVGMTLPYLSSKDYLDLDKVDSGLYLGVNAGTQITPYAPICFQTGLYFVEKGGKGYDNGNDVSLGLNYLEVPVQLVYRGIYNFASFQPYMGLYFATGVGGKYKDFTNRASCTSFGDLGLRRFDTGFRLGASVSLYMFYINAGFEWGFVNIGDDDFDEVRNRCGFLSIGFCF